MTIEDNLIKIDNSIEATYFKNVEVMPFAESFQTHELAGDVKNCFLFFDVKTNELLSSNFFWVTPTQLWEVIKPEEGKAYIKTTWQATCCVVGRNYKEQIDERDDSFNFKLNELTLNQSPEFLRQLYDLCQEAIR